MKKTDLTRVDIENIHELQELPEGKVLLVGPTPMDSDLVSYFTELGREVVPCETVLPDSLERNSRYASFAAAIIAEPPLLAEKEEVERDILEMNAALVENGILIAIFPSEAGVKAENGVFYSNRDIEHLISKRLTMVRIMTMISGARKVVARKGKSPASS